MLLRPATAASSSSETTLPSSAGVLGRARDGSYKLLGLNAPCAEAFEPMPWGSPSVAEITEARLEAAGFHVTVLETLADIDSASGLRVFLTRVALKGARAHRSLKRLAARLAQLAYTRF